MSYRPPFKATHWYREEDGVLHLHKTACGLNVGENTGEVPRERVFTDRGCCFNCKRARGLIDHDTWVMFR